MGGSVEYYKLSLYQARLISNFFHELEGKDITLPTAIEEIWKKLTDYIEYAGKRIY